MNTKTILAGLSVLLLLSATSLSAQTSAPDREYHSAVQVSFFPPLGTNGLHSSRYTNDFSFNLLTGVSKNEQAFAFAGLANVIMNDATGFQLAGLNNYTGGEGNGFQFAGLTNIVRGDFHGFQFAGLFNTASDVRGMQFAGLFNVAKEVRGVQFAGLVNIAEKSDYPIGLVNIIKESEMGIGVGYNEIGTVSVNFRSGGRVLYGILGVGYNHKVNKNKDAFSIVAGYGAHINILPWFRINNELTIENIDIFGGDNSGTFKTGYALLPAFRYGRFEIFGGPSINYMQSEDPDMIRDLFPKNSLWKKEHASGKRQQAFVGWQAGVQFFW